MRASGSEEQIRLSPIKKMTIEEAITYIQRNFIHF
jgi:predicted membrane GTPase involved in stress response